MLLITTLLTSALSLFNNCDAMGNNNSDLSVFKPVLKRFYNVLNSSWYINNSDSPNDILKVIEDEIYRKYRRQLSTKVTEPNNRDFPIDRSSSKKARFNRRCRCDECGWTGHPKPFYSGWQCEACGVAVYDPSLFPENKCPGLKTSSNTCSDSIDHLHNGFIYDSRLIYRGFFNKYSETDRKNKEFKYTNTQVWFYCYSCKKYLLIPMRTIYHNLS